MPGYAYRAMDAHGEPLRLSVTADAPEAVLLQARRNGHQVEMLYRLESAPEKRFVPWLSFPNLPPPKKLGASHALDLRAEYLRELLKAGRVTGRGGLWPAVDTANLLALAREALQRAYWEDHQRCVPGGQGGAAGASGAELEAPALDDLSAPESTTVSTLEPWEDAETTLPGLPRLPKLDASRTRWGVLLRAGLAMLDPAEPSRPGGGWTALPPALLASAFQAGATGLRVYAWKERTRVDYERGGRWVQAAEWPGPTWVELLVLLLGAACGFPPADLPPRERTLQARRAGGLYEVQARTYFRVEGQEIVLKWKPARE